MTDEKKNVICQMLMWAAASLLTAAAVFFQGFTGILLLAAAFLMMPVEKWQRFFDRFIAWKWLIVVLLIAAALCFELFAPSGNTVNNLSSFDPNFFLK